MKTSSNNRVYSAMVAWYGVYQAVHIVIIGAFFAGAINFPPEPDGTTWGEQVRAFFWGMASADLVNAVLSMVFVTAHFRGFARSGATLGAICLTSSMYSAYVYSCGTIRLGTWHDRVAEQLAMYIPFIPIVVLFGWHVARVWRSFER